MAELTPGTLAPDFEIPDQNGKPVRLSQFRGQKVVVYFYPKDDTTGCTAEACSFRDQTPQFVDADAVILGISDDSPDSHQKFVSKYTLPFTLLSDKGGKVRKAFGVQKTFGILPGRVTFVLDAKGVIRHVFSSQTAFQKHTSEALEAIRRMT